MKCPHCQHENRGVARFCMQCGKELPQKCPQCSKILPPKANFCDGCGYNVAKAPSVTPFDVTAEEQPPFPQLESERKYVTVLFSDLSGYTLMAERLDPEELKEVLSHTFRMISAVIGKYDGFIEKYVGDAIVAIFGAHMAHEDDPIRAIKAAREIHKLVDSISPPYEKKIGRPLSMHTGINTGIAVTGEMNFQKGTHGVVGDAINLASRLSNLAEAGQILVGQDTYIRSEGYFRFEELKPSKVKGKTRPVAVYRVLSPLDQPRKIHRLHGLQAEFIGREPELDQLRKAIGKLDKGKGSIFAICGAPGTGKSRLVEEFKDSLNLEEIQWREGHAYPYAQNIPYFPVINLLNRTFDIDENDTPHRIREKIEHGTANLVGKRDNVVPFLGSLYNLEYQELVGVNPEYWKNRLQKAIQTVLGAMAAQRPTVICFEDLHWADPSSLELLRLILLEAELPILFICVYRPAISLFTTRQMKRLGESHREIRLKDFSPTETNDMLESLLRTKILPTSLRNFIEEKVEGNPFYLEEAINVLIDSDILVKKNGSWELTRSVTEANISGTIHGVISARLDCLEKQTKRILQEASVIGRFFPFKILERITDHKQNIQSCLDNLVNLDLLRLKPQVKDLEYGFKHAITQEVVYDGLLRKERQEIHERIALVMEDIYKERLIEHSETLAYHFRKGKSLNKAVDYLIQSGKKSMKRYAVEESHRYYREAYTLLNQEIRDEAGQAALIRLLNTWSPVFYFRGKFKELETLLQDNIELAQSLGDKEELGMFFVWLGMVLWGRARFKDSYQYLHKALKLGEEIGSKRIIGYVGAWLPWPCVERGYFKEALIHAERAREMAQHFEADDYPYYQSLDSTAFVYYAAGEPSKILELGKALLKYGKEKSSIRATTWGHYVQGWSHMTAGDFPSAIGCTERAIQSSADPFYTQFPKLSLAMSYIFNQEYKQAREPLQDVFQHSQNFGSEILGTAAQVFLGVIDIEAGHFSQGMNMVKDAQNRFVENDGLWRFAITELVLGEIFRNFAQKRRTPIKISTIAHEFRFLIKNVPLANRKAVQHYRKAIESAQEIDAKGIQGQAFFGLGCLYASQKKRERAKECFSSAIKIFEEYKANTFLKSAAEALKSLGEEE